MPRGRWVSDSLRGVVLALCLALVTGAAHVQAAEGSPLPTFQTTRAGMIPTLDLRSALERPWLLGPGEGGDSQPTVATGSLLGIFPVQMTANPALADKPEMNYQSQITSKFTLTPKTELRVSFLYKQDPPETQTERGLQTHLLFKYSMDYRVLPNLQVGLTGYFYQQQLPDFLSWQNRQLRESIMGLGPGLQYDLGRWSFMVRSQLEAGGRDRSEGINSWFRVWYSF